MGVTHPLTDLLYERRTFLPKLFRRKDVLVGKWRPSTRRGATVFPQDVFLAVCLLGVPPFLHTSYNGIYCFALKNAFNIVDDHCTNRVGSFRVIQ